MSICDRATRPTPGRQAARRLEARKANHIGCGADRSMVVRHTPGDGTPKAKITDTALYSA